MQATTGQIQAQAAAITSTQRVLALAQVGVGITGSNVPTGTGDGVIFVFNAQTVPTGAASPVGGSIVYVDAGALKAIGTSGTTTTIAPA